MKRLVFDIDNTIAMKNGNDYRNSIPNIPVIDKIIEYKDNGFEIILFTSRNIRTHENNIGKINAKTLPVIIDWLKKYNVPFDEIYVGKPWCGEEGFYIDDRAIRPEEFIENTFEQIKKIIGSKV